MLSFGTRLEAERSNEAGAIVIILLIVYVVGHHTDPIAYLGDGGHVITCR